jgi:hypothetical protein
MTSCGSLAGHWRTTAPSPACGLIDCFLRRSDSCARVNGGKSERKRDHSLREESKAVEEAASVVKPVNKVGRNKNRRRSKKQRLPKNLARRRAWSRAHPSQSLPKNLARRMAEGVVKSASLAELSLQGNSLGNSGRQALGAALAATSTLTSLEYLCLSLALSLSRSAVCFWFVR